MEAAKCVFLDKFIHLVDTFKIQTQTQTQNYALTTVLVQRHSLSLSLSLFLFLSLSLLILHSYAFNLFKYPKKITTPYFLDSLCGIAPTNKPNRKQSQV